MQIQIQAPWEVNEYLRAVIIENVEKLNTYYDRIERADVYLKMGDTTVPEGKLLEIRLAVPGNDLFAQDTADSFEQAVAGTTEKLRRQLIKHKDKLNKR
ncbi:MAG: hypothetical protein DHS20C18_09040 [Saprospiraceae bacterium]|nr:MAG: hypothetical protein DHS20C18_09040 [Saprospiraceae bacterium]